jgi:hypothetical protein
MVKLLLFITYLKNYEININLSYNVYKYYMFYAYSNLIL